MKQFLGALARGWRAYRVLDYVVVIIYVEAFFIGLRLSTLSTTFEHFDTARSPNSKSATRGAITAWGLFVALLQDFCLLICMLILLRMFDRVCRPIPLVAGDQHASTLRSSHEGAQPLQESDESYVSTCMEDGLPHDVAHPKQSEQASSKQKTPFVTFGRRAIKYVFRFVVYALVFGIMVFPFCADNVLFRARKLRFTLDFIIMYLRERKYTKDFALAKRETEITNQVVAATVVLTIGFGLMGALLLDLTRWSPTHRTASWIVSILKRCWRSIRQRRSDNQRNLSDETCAADVTTPESWTPVVVSPEAHSPSAAAEKADASDSDSDSDSDTSKSWIKRDKTHLKLVKMVLTIGSLALMVWLTHAITFAVNPLAASLGVNTSLYEYFRWTLGIHMMPLDGEYSITTDELHQLVLDNNTETYELSAPQSLYRRTTGYKGDLAFDVELDPSDPPNILMINIESFRFHDSAYLAYSTNNHGDPLPQNLTNASVTPQFDKWAKRNIGFRNLWSSYRTSRAIEAILFGHDAYDSITNSITATGRKKLKLQGMPQFFKQKGYECIFSTGAKDSYDQWNQFLPAHGFETYYGLGAYKRMAKEAGYDLKTGGHLWTWGMHDDMSFDLLASLMEKKQQEQTQQAADGKKKPFFLNHYTISSHTPFTERPDWYKEFVEHNDSFPNFSPLYAGQEYAKDVKHYHEMRYFTDMALGKFMDRMHAKGILNNTIVIIAGDHGQAPEVGLAQPELDYPVVHHVAGALIAEGRLGKYAGLVLEDLAHHNDFLNTLADIVGVPQEGFYQTSIGRSLKRKMADPSKRIVHVNNPTTEYAVIQNNLRVQYDRMLDNIQVSSMTQDPALEHNLYHELARDASQQESILRLRSIGRFVNAYFRERVDGNCVTKSAC